MSTGFKTHRAVSHRSLSFATVTLQLGTERVIKQADFRPMFRAGNFSALHAGKTQAATACLNFQVQVLDLRFHVDASASVIWASAGVLDFRHSKMRETGQDAVQAVFLPNYVEYFC